MCPNHCFSTFSNPRFQILFLFMSSIRILLLRLEGTKIVLIRECDESRKVVSSTRFRKSASCGMRVYKMWTGSMGLQIGLFWKRVVIIIQCWASFQENGGDSSSRVSDYVLLSCSPGLVRKKIGYPISFDESDVETFVDDVFTWILFTKPNK